MPDFNIECQECGDDLKFSWQVGYQTTPNLRVEPCKRCIYKAEVQAYEDGKEENKP